MYDAAAGKTGLYVNGKLAGTGSGTIGWNSTGKLTIGSEMFNGVPAWNFPGSVSDVRTYQRALTDNEASAAYRLWSGESQLFFAGNSAGQSYTMTFNAPIEADYSLGAHLTNGPDYGKAKFSLDGAVITGTDTAPFDGYSTTATTSYRALGGAHLAAGTHTITVTLVDTNPASTGNRYQSGVDYVIAAPVNNVTAADFTAAMNNDGIGTDGTPARFDLAESSLSAQAMATAGLSPGANVTINGARFTLPAPNPTTGYDNVIAAGQTIPLPAAQRIQASAVGLLVTSTCGDSPETTGTITYTDNDSTTNPVYPRVSDWAHGPTASASFVLPYRNAGAVKDPTVRPRIYAVFIAAKPNKTLKSVTLPNIGTTFRSGCPDPALHVLAIAPRPAGTGWIGAWSAPVDAAITPQTNLTNTTLRTVVHPTVIGSQARIRLSNIFSDLPVTIGGASIAAQSGTGPATAATPTSLTFDGSAAVTIPPGGEVTSDPVTYPAGGNGNLVVSIHLPNTVTKAATHAMANGSVHLAAGNQTANSGATPFTTTLNHSYLLTGITVSTPDAAQGTVVVLGDQATAVGAGTNKTSWVDGLPDKLTTAGTPLPGGLVNASTAGVSATSRWKLNDGTGATVATDSVGANNATKSGNVTFGTDHDGSATFTNGNLATAGPVLTTSQSYTVSAWVKLTNTTNYATAVAQYGGQHNSAFRLYYSPTNGGKWIFGTSRTDTADLTDANAVFTAAEGTANTWTHLVGVYDATVGEVRLYVNGTRTGSAPGVLNWNSSGKLTIGSEIHDNSPTWYFPGSVSDVRAYPTAATDDDARILNSGGPTTGVQPGLGALTSARAVDSLQRAVLNQSAARTVIVSLGANDILAGADRATIKQRLTTLVDASSATGINRFYRTDGSRVQVLITTIAPLGLAPNDPREAVRTQLNQDILTDYTTLGATAAIDFDTAVATSPGANTVNPTYLTNGTPNSAYHDKLAQTVTDAVAGFPPAEL
ncbi:LamG-like jellyroll fold domain-containing protein [Actinosynnema sp. NPDC051121]